MLEASRDVLYNERMHKSMTERQASKSFQAVIDAAKRPGVSVVITNEGLSQVVVMSFEDFEGWQETKEIRADRSMDKDIRAGIKEMKSGKRPKNTISLDALKKKLKI